MPGPIEAAAGRPVEAHWAVTELVWVEAWQFQCCGEPASLGDVVTWLVADHAPNEFDAALGPEWVGRIPFVEDHHDVDPDLRTVTGTVTTIREVTYRLQPSPVAGEPRAMGPAPGTGRLKPVTAMNPWAPEHREERAKKGYRFGGWIVGLRVRPGEPSSWLRTAGR